MLVALLSSQHTVSGESSADIDKFRADARIGGQSVLSRQVDFALKSGSEKIIILSQGFTPELVDVQHHIEKAGAVFHAMRSAINLSGLISVADDVLVIVDGLIFDGHLGSEYIGPHRTVLTLQADTAVDLGFERIDQTRAWAGVMLIPGRLVEKLAELPVDVDPQSSLLRLALQNGVRCAALPDDAIAQNQWALVTSPDISQAYEKVWLTAHARIAPVYAPINLLADISAKVTLRKHPKASLAALSGNLIGLAVVSGALLAGYSGYAVWGLGLTALAWFSVRFSGSLSFLLHQGESTGKPTFRRAIALIFDIALIILCIMAVPTFAQIGTGFAVMVLVGLLRLAELTSGDVWWHKWRAVLEDRGLLSAALFTAGLMDLTLSSIQLFTLVILGTLLLQKFRARITPT